MPSFTLDEKDEEEESALAGAIDKIVIDMTKHLPEGSVVNMDNYYTSISSACELLKKKILVRGTVRSNRI